MINFSDIIATVPQSLLVESKIQHLKELESDLLFSISLKKDEILRAKRQYFSANSLKNIVVIQNHTNLGHLSKHLLDHRINFISADALKTQHIDNNLTASLNDSLVIMTNNLFSEIGISRLCSLYENTPNTIYAVHDYDNHHWIQNSVQIAIFADIYFPAHQEDLALSGRLNPNVIGGIPCGSNQWEIDFLKNNKTSILNAPRSNEPLGKYYFYEKFIHRNKTIATLSALYPSINITTNDFHHLTDEQKLKEWASHKLHWIIPVLNDLPIRFFNALITGGLPLVPRSLISSLKNLQVPNEFYATYSPLDIVEPALFIKKQLEKFDLEGAEGIERRFNFGVENFHIDRLCAQMLNSCRAIYEMKTSA